MSKLFSNNNRNHPQKSPKVCFLYFQKFDAGSVERPDDNRETPVIFRHQGDSGTRL